MVEHMGTLTAPDINDVRVLVEDTVFEIVVAKFIPLCEKGFVFFSKLAGCDDAR